MKKFNCYLLACCLLAPVAASAEELINCVEDDGFVAADGFGRGFVVANYPGFTLDQVYLFFDAVEAGEGVYQLTATTDSFNGDVIGVAEARYTFTGNRAPIPVVFDFQRASVINGQLISFALSQESGPQTLYKVGNFNLSPSNCLITQTDNITTPTGLPPRRNGITAIITGAAEEIMPSMGILENPGDGSDGSGVVAISGWVCDAERVEVEIDDSILVEAAYGTPRADTMDACGDADNGFGILVNLGVLGDGEHTIRLLADDQEIDTAMFNVTTLGEPFVTGLSGTFDLTDFPETGQQVTIQWIQSLQNFVITEFTE